MRALPIWAIAIGVMTLLPLVAGSDLGISLPNNQAGVYRVKIEADPGIEYSYELEGNVLVLYLSVFRGDPCEEVRVTRESLGDNRFQVIVHVVETAEACIQVVPPPSKIALKLQLDPEVPDVYVRVRRVFETTSPPEINVLPIQNPPEIGLPDIRTPEDCNELLRKIREFEKNEPEIAVKLRWVYEEHCLLPNRCAWIMEMLEELKQRANKGEDVNAEIERLELLYRKCTLGPAPEMQPELPTEIINTVAAVKHVLDKNIEEEIQQIKEKIQEISHTLEKVGEHMRIVAKKLTSTIRISPGKLVVEGEELNLPRAEIVVDINRGLKVRIEQNNVALEENNVQARVDIEVTITPEGKIISTVSGKEIAVDPEEVVDKVQGLVHRIKDISLVDDGNKPKYIVTGEREGKLLWILPVRYNVEIEVDAGQGTVTGEKKPWWSFLVFP